MKREDRNPLDIVATSDPLSFQDDNHNLLPLSIFDYLMNIAIIPTNLKE